MSNIQENIAAYNRALGLVAEHCMADSVERGSGKVIIWYPDGYYPNGIRVDDSAKGLMQALPLMERHWLESFPGGNGMEN